MSDKIWIDGGGWTSPKDYIDEVLDFPQINNKKWSHEICRDYYYIKT